LYRIATILCREVNIIQVLEHISRDRKLPFLVIGGHAVAASGFSRTTGDLDVLVQKDHRVSWTEALKIIGYKCISDQATFAQFEGQLWDWPVDLMFVNATTFAKMWDARVSVTISDVSVSIPFPEHLVALKLHALRYGPPRRAQKDLKDIVELVIANQLRDKLRDLCDRFGTVELYERINSALTEERS
jgi:hypothetical protein